jgi:hypothetical protein
LRTHPTVVEIIIFSDRSQDCRTKRLDCDWSGHDPNHVAGAYRNVAREIDGEIGDSISVDVALKNCSPQGIVVIIRQRSSPSVERRGANKAEQINGAGRNDGVESAEINPVDA